MIARLKAAWSAFRASKSAPESQQVFQPMMLGVQRAKNGMVLLRFGVVGTEDEMIYCLPQAGARRLLDALADVLLPDPSPHPGEIPQ